LNPGLWPKEKWDELYGLEKCREAVEATQGCTGCAIRCKVIQRVPDGPWAGTRTGNSHFLHTAIVGQTLGIEDWRAAVRLLDLCNRSGACAVSVAGLLLLATFGLEAGMLTKDPTGGISLKQGDVHGYLALLEKIIRRQDIGDVFADGLLAGGRHMGLDVGQFVGIIKGSPCIHDPRDARMDPRGFHQMVNPRGGDHSQCDWTLVRPKLPLETIRRAFRMTGSTEADADRIFDADGFNCGRLTCHVEDSGMVFDSMGACVLYPVTGMPLQVDTLAKLYSAATGMESSAAEVKAAGERGNNLHRLSYTLLLVNTFFFLLRTVSLPPTIADTV
jgi:aldehyde:ferredoxin oxidoreductase